MASLVYKNGRAIVQFMLNKERKTISLGKRSEDRVKVFVRRIETMLVCLRFEDAFPAEIDIWLRKMTNPEHKKLSDVGLVAPRGSTEIGAFIDSYIAGRVDLSGRSHSNLGIAANHIKTFFGNGCPLRDVTPADAHEFAAFARSTMAEATAARIVGRARQFFEAAIRSRLLSENPFVGIKLGSQENEERKFFVTREMIYKVLNACPDYQWRLIVALSRFGGVRCPSETFALKWTDINWDQARFTVRKHKTKTRQVPLFPELYPYLRDSFEAAADRTTYCITRYRDTESNLRTTLCKIIERAGLVPWEKPLHNLRASRETELAAEYPLHVVCAWIGNSERVAKKHYLMVRESDFERAAKSAAVPRFTSATGEHPVSENDAKAVSGHHSFHGMSPVPAYGQDHYPRQDSTQDDISSIFPTDRFDALQKALHSKLTRDLRPDDQDDDSITEPPGAFVPFDDLLDPSYLWEDE